MRKTMAVVLVAAMLLAFAPMSLAASYLPLSIMGNNWFPNSNMATWNGSKLVYADGSGDTGVTVALDTSLAYVGQYTLTITGAFDIFEEHYYAAYSSSMLGTKDRMILIPYEIAEAGFNYSSLYVDSLTPAYSWWKPTSTGTQYYLYFKPEKGGNTKTFTLTQVYTSTAATLTVKYIDSSASTSSTATSGTYLKAIEVVGNQAANVAVSNSGRQLRADIAALTKEDCEALAKGSSTLTIRVRPMKDAVNGFTPLSKVTSVSNTWGSAVSLAGSDRPTGIGDSSYILDQNGCFVINITNLFATGFTANDINNFSTRMGGRTLSFTIMEGTVLHNFDIDFVWQKVERGESKLISIDSSIEVKVGDTKTINYELQNETAFSSAITWKALSNNGNILLNDNKVTGLKVGKSYVLVTFGGEETVVTVNVVNQYSAASTQTPAATQTPGQTTSDKCIVVASSLRIRNGAGTSFKQIGSLKRGVVITVTEWLDNGWCKINHNGQVGYVSGQYLSKQ